MASVPETLTTGKLAPEHIDWLTGAEISPDLVAIEPDFYQPTPEEEREGAEICATMRLDSFISLEPNPGPRKARIEEPCMTAEDLWDEYREKVCPPDLDEPPWFLYWQRQAFLAGVTATIGNILLRPLVLQRVARIARDLVAVEKRRTTVIPEPDEPVYLVAVLFACRPVVTCFGLDGLLDAVPRLEPDLYRILDADNRDVGTASRGPGDDWLIEFKSGLKAGPGYIIV